MAEVLLTKRIEFAAAHRYQNDAWDAARNRAVFGACNNASGHGHNYLLEVTVAGPVDEHTGMVVNLYDLKQDLKQVLEEFDHKHLNLDTRYFRQQIPTAENFAHVLWNILTKKPEIGRLEKIRLYEDEDLFAEVTAEAIRTARPGCRRASLTRRYQFSAAHQVSSDRLSEAENRRAFGRCGTPGAHGHNYLCDVTIQGEIDPDTGMVTDLSALDRLVGETVLRRFDHRDLSHDPEFAARVATGEHLVRLIWDLLVKAIPVGRLERVALAETQDTSYEYGGEAKLKMKN